MVPTAGGDSCSVIQCLSLLVNDSSKTQISAVSKTNLRTRGPAITPESPPLRVDAQKVIRVGKTRVTLDTIVAAFQHGDTPEEIARNYDALSLGEVYQTIGYYLAHQTELDAYLERREASRASLQKEVEGQHNPNGIRARLLARRKQPA
jgi:uncharacterized protein (DUF433 family)